MLRLSQAVDLVTGWTRVLPGISQASQHGHQPVLASIGTRQAVFVVQGQAVLSQRVLPAEGISQCWQ